MKYFFLILIIAIGCSDIYGDKEESYFRDTDYLCKKEYPIDKLENTNDNNSNAVKLEVTSVLFSHRIRKKEKVQKEKVGLEWKVKSTEIEKEYITCSMRAYYTSDRFESHSETLNTSNYATPCETFINGVGHGVSIFNLEKEQLMIKVSNNGSLLFSDRFKCTQMVGKEYY